MTARIRPGDALLGAFLVLLLVDLGGRVRTVAQVHEREHVRAAAFARYAQRWPGVFGPVTTVYGHRTDTSCALHLPGPRARSDFRLCVVLATHAGRTRVIRAYTTPRR